MARTAKPCITHRDLTAPTLTANPVNDPNRVWELEHDGVQALLPESGERSSIVTGRGNDLLHLFPGIGADLRKLPGLALDGGLLMPDAKGKPEFHQLRGRCAIRDPGSIGKAA